MLINDPANGPNALSLSTTMSTPPPSKLRMRLLCTALILMTGAAGLSGADSLLIERTLMPDAAPSSFAVGFPNGVNFCYDVVRGGLSYIWRGDFVDVSNVRPNAGKSITPVKLLGNVVYREEGFFPLRLGDPQNGVEFVFKGYHLAGNAIEFRYEINRHRVREEVTALPDGSGLLRRFRIQAAVEGETWWYIPGSRSGGKLAAANAVPDAGGFRFDAAREFTLEVHFAKASP
jgi:hypothetical protein